MEGLAVNIKWKVIKMESSVNEEASPQTITFNIYIKRQGTYYGFAYILPAVLLAVMTIVYLLLRPLGLVKYIFGEFKMLKLVLSILKA